MRTSRRPATYLAAGLAALVWALSPALATERFCIEWDGFDGGPSQAQECPDHSLGLEYHHLADRDMSGGGPGPLQHRLVIVTIPWDKAATELWQRLDSGTVIQTVTMRFGRALGSNEQRFSVTLNNARVLGIEPIIPHINDADHANFANQYRVRLNYTSMEIQNEQFGLTYLITTTP